MDARHELLTAQGVEILKPPTTQPWGRLSVWLRDRPRNLPPGGKQGRTPPGTVTRAKGGGSDNDAGERTRGRRGQMMPPLARSTWPLTQ
ncbi:conserved hypothetical protein [Streptomyces sviceus ATCC 29083]|uniref:Uncharacterized protein n=1 Tax=Streptomyces sviceus (strain ATCC 29083 / DSM 924 / JCM 4929 / NBRC 13980 / NCIMB 11184 / NRRL 5439 / UC 5370) TaxID=463191 RepID=B5I1E1_STRX2|nr:conserved hypothetical protein [Streptomyces sviceus ATCC 29083]